MEMTRTGMGHWLGRMEETLDGYGRGAWLAAMVVGFVLFWPIGLAILGYMLWSGRMGCWSKGKRRGEKMRGRFGATGNRAFDDYREETLRRLEEEREAFAEFLERLRRAKDQAEFDQFMSERNRPDQSQAGASATSGA